MICKKCGKETGTRDNFCNQFCFDKYNKEEDFRFLMRIERLPVDFLSNHGWRNNQESLYKIGRQKRNSMWIHGKSGRGKTRLAYMFLYDAYPKMVSRVEAYPAQYLFTLDRHYEGIRAPLVLIDDVHAVGWNSLTAPMLHAFLNVREQRKQQTIITCEFDINTFRKRAEKASDGVIGFAALKRMNCCGRRLDLHVEGDDLRMEGTK